MTFDALSVLREAGNPVDLLTEEPRAALSQPSVNEIEALKH